MSIGSIGTITRDEMLKHVSDNDKIGEQIIDTEKSFFGIVCYTICIMKLIQRKEYTDQLSTYRDVNL
ncbi:hypothetical protein FACS189431_0350 [Alphaproteobacteria bacterium]|nr:hypothetical protein FACS189431_0350 [Alphaproteobacteria bacterium]